MGFALLSPSYKSQTRVSVASVSLW